MTRRKTDTEAEAAHLLRGLGLTKAEIESRLALDDAGDVFDARRRDPRTINTTEIIMLVEIAQFAEFVGLFARAYCEPLLGLNEYYSCVNANAVLEQGAPLYDEFGKEAARLLRMPATRAVEKRIKDAVRNKGEFVQNDQVLKNRLRQRKWTFSVEGEI
jgi:hypothetical protein